MQPPRPQTDNTRLQQSKDIFSDIFSICILSKWWGVSQTHSERRETVLLESFISLSAMFFDRQKQTRDPFHLVYWQHWQHYKNAKHHTLSGIEWKNVLGISACCFPSLEVRESLKGFANSLDWPPWNCCRASWGKCWFICQMLWRAARGCQWKRRSVLWPALRRSTETPCWLEKSRVLHFGALSLSYFREVEGAASGGMCVVCVLVKTFTVQETTVGYQPVKPSIRPRV